MRAVHRRRTCAGVGLLLLLASGPARVAAAQETAPAIGYVYPAGGQRGTTVRVTLGGQNLRQPGAVSFTGRGVRASVVEYTGGGGFLNHQQRYLLLRKLWEVEERRLKDERLVIGDIRQIQEAQRKRWPWRMLNEPVDTDGYELPKHPLLIDIETRSLRELAHIQSLFFFPREKIQENRQLSEHVVLDVVIAANAEPGTREVRLETEHGVSNPMRFQVGTPREVLETEPNDTAADELARRLPRLAERVKTETLTLPVEINGQIMPGDVDRFRFRVRGGQELVVAAAARELIPYLADAVPGWFQAVLSLYDAAGNEVAYADDRGFDPDPVLRYRAPADGEYELAIRDAIYRGRQDFVYRIRLAHAADRAAKSPDADPPPADLFARGPDSLQNPLEREPNDTAADAQAVRLPHAVSGRIGRPGDVDSFRVAGRAGEAIVAEVYGRRIGSPLDSLLRLKDAAGRTLAWNDDHMVRAGTLHADHLGVQTHLADSYLAATLPSAGIYTLELSDAQRRGGPDYAYTLRIGPPRPDFALRVTPSALSMPRGGVLPITVHALRQDGFAGEIEVALTDVPAGTRLEGGVIPAGVNQARMTVVAPQDPTASPAPIGVQGVARIDGKVVRRDAVPADDRMQAFLWRHLVPSRELVFDVQQRWSPVPALERVGRGPVRLTPGGEAEVDMRAPRRFRQGDDDRILLRLDDPPAGIALDAASTRVDTGGVTFRLTAASGSPPPAFEGNLIVEVIREFTPRRADGTLARQRVQRPVGYLPAIPVRCGSVD